MTFQICSERKLKLQGFLEMGRPYLKISKSKQTKDKRMAWYGPINKEYKWK